MSERWADATHAMSGGNHEKPKKEIDHIKTSKSDTKGDHIHEHHHTHPDHHPMEKHTTRGDDEMAAHMMQNMGTQNPGEAQADAGDPGQPVDPASAASVPPMAAPGAPGPGMAAPGGM